MSSIPGRVLNADPLRYLRFPALIMEIRTFGVLLQHYICETAICLSCALTDHRGHTKIVPEETAQERKLQVKSMIESPKETALQKRTNVIAKLDESCKQIQEQTATEKQNAQLTPASYF